jgi:hypothetical protein
LDHLPKGHCKLPKIVTFRDWLLAERRAICAS